MLLRQFVIEGLGHLSTLLADESAGVAAVVDPRRDVDLYLAEAAARDPMAMANGARALSEAVRGLDGGRLVDVAG